MRHTPGYFAKLCVGLSALIASAALTAHAQTLYRITDISSLEPGTSFPRSINSRGQVIVDGPSGPYRYDNGSIFELAPVLGPQSIARVINDVGDIAGERRSQPTWAFLYSGGIVRNLPTLSSSGRDLVDAMNNAGEVTLHGIIFSDRVEYHASIYSNGALIRIPGLGGDYARARGINDLGHAVGDATIEGDTTTHAFLYRDSKMFDLGTLGGQHSRACDINDRGNIVGYADLPEDGKDSAFLYRQDGLGAARMIALGVLGTGDSSMAVAINNVDEIVGLSKIISGDIREHAFLYKNGRLWNLNDLIDPQDSLIHQVVLTYATDINDSGWIIVSGRDLRNPDYTRAYLLRPSGPQ